LAVSQFLLPIFHLEQIHVMGVAKAAHAFIKAS
jgi:hypothetical protein